MSYCLKHNVVLEVLGIQERNNNMKKILFAALIGCIAASCSTTKNTHKTSKFEPVAIEETQLNEEQINEFEYIFIEALKQKHAGNLDNAKQIFARCLEIDPRSAVCMYEMGKLHYAQKDVTSAALLLEKAVDLNPNNIWYKLTLAQVYQHAQRYGLAAEINGELYKMNPENTQYLYTQAYLYGVNQDYDAAIKAYNKLGEITGLKAETVIAKQSLYLENNQPEKAVSELQSLIDEFPNEVQYYGLLTELYQKQGDKNKALKVYDKMLEIAPENAYVHLSLADFYRKENEIDTAFDYAKKAFNSDSLDVDGKVQYYLMATSNTDGTPWSEEQINELLSILHDKYPEDDRMYAIYADHFMRQGKQLEARENLSKYLKSNPNSYEMTWQYLLLSNELEDWERLLVDSKKATELYPTQTSFYMLQAVAELQLEMYLEAIETSEKGLEYAGNDAMAKSQLEVFIADANYQLGNIKEAIAAYKKVVELDPTNYAAMNNYAYYLSVEEMNLDKAEMYANKAIQANPTSATYLDTYAWVLFKQGNYSLAKFYQETALEYNEDKSGVLFEHYGDILYMLGEKEEALKQWEKAKEIGDHSDLLDEKIKQKTYID